MSVYLSKDGDYGFLTGIQQQSPDHQFGPNVLPYAFDQNENQTKSNNKREKLNRKKSWWKSMFSFQKKCKNRDLKNSTILRHKSDADALRKPSLKQDKNRKYRSLLIDDSITVYDGLDFEVSLSNSPFNKQDTKAQCDQHEKITFAQRERSASLDFLDRMKPEKKSENLHRHSTVTTLVDNPMVNKNHTIETDRLHVPLDSGKPDKKKPTKPPRQTKFTTDNKSKHSKKKHASLEDLLSNKTGSEEYKTPMRRSMSMTFLRKPFRKKKKENLLSKCESKASTLQHVTSNNAKDKTFIDKDTGRVINVYEKYPRTKTEQKKVLVHIYTREEIPIENGIPQWDATSYIYSSSTRCRSSQSTNQLNPAFETNVKSFYKESSFLGNSESQQTEDTVEEVKSLDGDIAETTYGSENILLGKEIDILSLDTEPVNRELHCGTQSITKAIVHNEKHSSFTNCDQKEESVETSSINNRELPSFSKSASQELSTSCEDVSFGRSFILTGLASDKVPDLITRKHPYLVTSSPVRHMAQCLRHASISGKPLKISPNRTKLNMNLENVDINANENSGNLKHLESIDGCTKESASTEKNYNNGDNKRHVTFEKNYPPRHRRCYSDPDLSSSFDMCPMKLAHGNDSSTKDEHGKKPLRSRSARTDRLLYRMKTRLHRLEKLRDKLPYQNLIQENDLKATAGSAISPDTNSLHDPLPLPCSRRASMYDIRQSEIEKYKKFRQWKEVQLPGCNLNKTPLSKFKQLIDTRVANYNNDKQKNSKVLQDNGRNILPSVPFYENIWPSENYISESNSNTGLSRIEKSECAEKSPNPNTITIACIKAQNSNSNVDKVLHSPVEIKEVKFNLRKTSLGSNSENYFKCEQTDNADLQKAVMQSDDIFLSSTPVKNYAKYARAALECESSTSRKRCSTLDCNDKISHSPTCIESQQSVSSNPESLSPNPSLMPSASDFFLRSLLEQQEEIKQTMMSEMRKIRTKYNEVCCETIGAEEEAQTSFNDWKEHMKFRWEAGWHGDDERSSESDANSQKTLTLCSSSGTSSSGETITNIVDADHEDGYATMSSNESTVANYGSISRPTELTQRRCITSKWVESNLEKRRPVEYVLPRCLSLEDGSNFMDWDCEETDL